MLLEISGEIPTERMKRQKQNKNKTQLRLCLVMEEKSYALLLFTALDFTSILSHTHNWVLFLL